MTTSSPGEQDFEITLERGGGFAGIANHQQLGPVATDQLEPGLREAVVGLGQAGREAAVAATPPEAGIPDGMWVQVEIRSGDDVRRVRWPERRPPSPVLDELYRIVAGQGQWRRAL
ncbi:protealysin inhibitor emfourin [Nocardioides sp.]|uniref:protealysin inhibitor emfourin n=1 Tax=Nocardioides sp. TaxID=35761 RepID=UPI0031FECBBC|nr:hypothetical protein [Nocardioides sp.]